MREKMIELLAKTPGIGWSPSARQMVADQLIANGVTVQKWIPVSERLPEKFKTVLVYCKNKTIRGGTVCHIGSCDNGFWFLARQAGTESFPDLEWEVTHWMPLPEPPKGE